MNPIPEKGGYAAGGRTVSELPPPPPSVSIRGEVRPETMTPDDPATTLEEIRRDAKDETEGLGPTRRASKRDAPRLVAALEAVLGLHQPTPIYGMADDGKKSLCDHPFGEDTDAHFEGDDGYWYCRDKKTGERCSSCADEDQADLWEEWPCPTYLAITRALNGETGA